MRESRGGGGRGSGPPLKNQKNIGFLSDTGPDSLKNQTCMQCWSVICPPAKRHFNSVSLTGRWWSDLGVTLLLSPLTNYKKQTNKKSSVFDSLWQTFWIRACVFILGTGEQVLRHLTVKTQMKFRLIRRFISASALFAKLRKSSGTEIHHFI